ncbi:MAG: amidohydrolase family protein [Betaproteobacteria bacterium]
MIPEESADKHGQRNPRRTLIRGADWIVAWDAAVGRHTYMKGADIAFEAGALVHVGKGYSGPADRIVEGRGRLVMPGLVNIHSHAGREPIFRGIREEHGVPGHHMTGLFERFQAFGPGDLDSRIACLELAACELLRSGVTSIVDIGAAWEGWADAMARTGLRAFLAPGFASAAWKVASDLEVGYEWDEAEGRKRFEASLRFIDGLAAHPSGRISGIVTPSQIDTCTEDLLRDSLAAAKERRIPYTVHIAQGITEVKEMLRRHGRTPIRWAADIGILGPDTILGHAIFPDSHSWLRREAGVATAEDIALMGAHGCTVAHCPTVFARNGILMESFGRYRKAGVNMGIGTDTTPQNMLEEMRTASTLARIADHHVYATSIDEIFHAATIGGSKALLREDLGRLAPGAKADLVIVDLAHPDMQPARDPLRSLVFHAADRAVREVFVDGVQVMAEGKVLTVDAVSAGGRLAEAQRRMMSGVPGRDYRRRSADEIAPPSLPPSRR